MPRFGLVVSLLLIGVGSAFSQTLASSDPFAISLAQKSMAALTGGASVADVTLNANATSISGSDYQQGTATLEAKGTREARIDLSLPGGKRSDVRSLANAAPVGSWQRNGEPVTAYAWHNCWTDAAWFFPVFSSLAQTANQRFIFAYVGPELHDNVATQHIQIYQVQSGSADVQRLSKTDFYLDANSYLPIAISSYLHPDDNFIVDVPVEVNFANYQDVSGVRIPFHVQQSMNGTVMLDLTITGAILNSGLLDTAFNLQ